MILRLLGSSLAARRWRVTIALMAVALGVAVTTALATLALQVGDDLARTLRAAGPNFVVLPAGARLPVDLGGAAFEPARAGLALPESSVVQLKRSFWKNNVLEAAPELSVHTRYDGVPFTLVGTWFVHDLRLDEGVWRTGIRSLRPHWNLAAGTWPGVLPGKGAETDTPEMVLSHGLAKRLGNFSFVSPSSFSSTMNGFPVTGIVDTGNPDELVAWAPLAAVQRFAGRPDEIDRIWISALVKPAPRKQPPDPRRDPTGYERWMCTAYPANVAKELAERIPGSEVLPMSEVVAGEGMVVKRLNLLMVLLALAALTASTLGLLSTTAATVVERGVELGLLRALGATSNQIAALLMSETIVVSTAGGLLGWALGVMLAGAIRGRTFGTVSGAPPLLLPLALALSLVVAVLGTFGPLRAALRVDAATVLRG